MSGARKVPNDGRGHCDNCGKALGAHKWYSGDSTGCTKKCAEADEAFDNMLADEQANDTYEYINMGGVKVVLR